MSDPWLALTMGSDPAERISEVGHAYELFLTGGSAQKMVRPVVRDSWRRSAGALVDPDRCAPIEMDERELEAYRTGHPLARVMPIFRDLLGGLADDGAHLMAVCDAQGRLLWVEGSPGIMRGAETMNFVPGARWDEAHAGTNAPGTALAVDHGVQIFATEHFSRGVQRWTCAAAPIHDPATGRLLGAIDVTGGDHLAHPHSLALVRATALAAEAFLTIDASRELTVSLLGRGDALVSAGGKRVKLGRRHSELLALLLWHADGRTGEQLGFDLDDRDLNPVTVRAELSRLRRILGPDVLESRPYRLRGGMTSDLTDTVRLIGQNHLKAALNVYAGPLLPSSDAPGIVRLRHLLEARLRSALLAAGDAELMRTWLCTAWGAEDLAMWAAYESALPAGAPALTLARDAISRLDAEYGVATSVQRR
jgi:hypothetical protein